VSQEVDGAREQLASLQKDPGADAGKIDEAARRLAAVEGKLKLAQQPVTRVADRESQFQALQMQIKAVEQTLVSNERSEEQLRTLRASLVTLAGLAGKRLASIEFRGISEEAGKDLLSRLPLHEGDTLTADSIEAARQAVRQFDEHLEFGFRFRPWAGESESAGVGAADSSGGRHVGSISRSSTFTGKGRHIVPPSRISSVLRNPRSTAATFSSGDAAEDGRHI
jgi:hypothetical protein